MPELMISIPLAKLKASPANPRKHLGNPAKIAEMAASMKEHGVLEPVIARQAKRGDSYELVCGHRRLEAAKLAELEGIPAIVRKLTDDQVLDIQIIENSHREDVHPLDEAEAFAQAIERGRTLGSIAGAIGRPASFVALRLQLLKLSKDGREAFDKGEITLAVAQLVARIPDAKLQRECIDDIRQDSYDGPVTADEARKLIEERYMLRLGDAPFDITDAKLVPKAGACGACPKRTGQQAQLFADVKNADLCTDPTCFKAKKYAVLQIRLKEAKTSGQVVLEGKAAEKAFGYGSDYVDLDDDQWVGGKNKKNRAIVGKAKPPVVLAKGRDGELHELVKKSDFQKLLPKPAARENQRETASSRAIAKASKDRAAKERRRAVAINAAIGLAVERCSQLKSEQLIALFVGSMIKMCWNDTQMAIIKRRGLQETDRKGNARRVPAERCLSEHAAKLKAPVLAALGLEIVLRKAAPHPNFGSNPQWGEALKLLKIDFAKIEREAAAAAKTKKKPAAKTAPATKKGPAKKKAAKKRKAKR